jgi:fibronectin-binding autotransporter adhesin
MVLLLEVFMSKQRVKIYRLCFLCLAAAMLLLVSSVAQALDCTWMVASGNWSDTSPNPWNLAEPLVGDYGYITNGGTANITSAGETCLTLYVGSDKGTTDMTGHVVMTGGDLTLGTAGGFYVGNRGTGTVDQSAGTINAITGGGQGLKLGGLSSAFYTSTGTYTLSGTATLTSGGGETIGQFGTGHFIQNGGTHKVYSNLSSTYSPMVIGQYSGDGLGNGGVGTYEMNGGTLTANVMTIGVNSGSNGQVSQAGGTITLMSATSGINLASGTGSTGTYNLTGGTLILNLLKKGTGNGTFNFGLGTIKAGGATFTPSTLNLNLNGASSASSTVTQATVDTNNVPVALGGILSGSGGLNKAGSGTLTLSNANTFTGETDVQVGTLSVTGSLSSIGSVVVSPAAILAGTGSVGSVAVNGGGHIAPGVSGVGTLTDLGLTLSSGAKLDFDLDTTTASDLISMSASNLSLNGQQFSDFSFTALTGFGPGVYTLIDAGSISGTGLGGTVTGQINGLDATLMVSDNDLVLNVVPEPGTLALLAMAGLALLGYVGRRRQ